MTIPFLSKGETRQNCRMKSARPLDETHQSPTRPQAAEDTRLGRLAGWCHDHRRAVLGLWLVALVSFGAASGAVGTKFSNQFGGDGSESARAQTLLQQRFPTHAGASATVVFHSKAPVTDAATLRQVAALTAKLRALPDIATVAPPNPAAGAAGQISKDGHIAFTTVTFTKDISTIAKVTVQGVVDTANAANTKTFQVDVGGQPISLVSQPNMGSNEVLGILAAIIILLVAFGSVIAMGLPIMTAVFGLGIGVSLLAFVSHSLTTPSFAPEMAIMIALGVGIDYALFIVTRHRETLHGGATPRHAAVTALATSGRAVLFAGSTVVISLLGMLLLGMSFIYGVAIGAIAAVVMVMLAAVTLLPAMLGFAGHAIDRFGIQRFLHRGEGDKERTMSYRWSRLVQHHPWQMGGTALVVLIILAIPLFSMHQAFSDQGNDPTSLTTRRAYNLLSAGFGPGFNGPLIVAVDLPGGKNHDVATKLAGAFLGAKGVAFAAPPQFNAKGDAATVLVVPTTSPQDMRTQALVNHLRTKVIPPVVAGSSVRALVGGITAASVDSSAHLTRRLPWVIGGVVILSFLLLMAVFRSIVVPLKAAIMNLLSIGAAYGIIVAVFQWGWLGSLIGISSTGPIDPWIPLMLFTILFGLSMDYEVFLLSRIREEWLHTGDNYSSVADGLAGTARVITAAAAIMVCVFGSFVLGDIRVLKLFGLGLASAVFIDATLVRMILVPATMELLGNANWWFPRWLDRFVPSLGVEVTFEDRLASANSPDIDLSERVDA